jgi:hypothetical protein
MHEFEGRVQFEVFEKLTGSLCFSKLHEKLYYYLLINKYTWKNYAVTCEIVKNAGHFCHIFVC